MDSPTYTQLENAAMSTFNKPLLAHQNTVHTANAQTTSPASFNASVATVAGKTEMVAAAAVADGSLYLTQRSSSSVAQLATSMYDPSGSLIPSPTNGSTPYYDLKGDGGLAWSSVSPITYSGLRPGGEAPAAAAFFTPPLPPSGAGTPTSPAAASKNPSLGHYAHYVPTAATSNLTYAGLAAVQPTVAEAAASEPPRYTRKQRRGKSRLITFPPCSRARLLGHLFTAVHGADSGRPAANHCPMHALPSQGGGHRLAHPIQPHV